MHPGQPYCGRQLALLFSAGHLSKDEKHRVTTISADLYKPKGPRSQPKTITPGQWTFVVAYEPGERQGEGPDPPKRPTVRYSFVTAKSPDQDGAKKFPKIIVTGLDGFLERTFSSDRDQQETRRRVFNRWMKYVRSKHICPNVGIKIFPRNEIVSWLRAEEFS